jgi:hypothetical protein
MIEPEEILLHRKAMRLRFTQAVRESFEFDEFDFDARSTVLWLSKQKLCGYSCGLSSGWHLGSFMRGASARETDAPWLSQSLLNSDCLAIARTCAVACL